MKVLSQFLLWLLLNLCHLKSLNLRSSCWTESFGQGFRARQVGVFSGCSIQSLWATPACVSASARLHRAASSGAWEAKSNKAITHHSLKNTYSVDQEAWIHLARGDSAVGVCVKEPSREKGIFLQSVKDCFQSRRTGLKKDYIALAPTCKNPGQIWVKSCPFLSVNLHCHLVSEPSYVSPHSLGSLH